ncbi:hypothetical protein H1C71_010204 [Ictidomys tridecemlineatus]|nr:hypothetical protein H1C71_010204 [Ictidomys tridecemlineatus]
MLEAQDEIVPGDIRYRLEPLVLAPLQMQLQHSSSQPFKHRWLPFSRTYGERFMPWKTEPKIYHGVKPYHSGAFQSPGQLPVLGSTNPAENSKKPELQPSLLNSPSGNVWLQGEHNMTTPHQISFQSPPLGLSILPVHMQSRKVAPIVRRGHAEYPNQQYQSDFQAPPWSQVLTPDPDKRSHRIDKYIQHVQKGTVGGQHCTAGVHQQPSWSQREMAILDGKCVAKFDGNTVTKGSSKTSSKLKLPANNSSRTGELNPMCSRNLITEAMRSSWVHRHQLKMQPPGGPLTCPCLLNGLNCVSPRSMA